MASTELQVIKPGGTGEILHHAVLANLESLPGAFVEYSIGCFKMFWTVRHFKVLPDPNSAQLLFEAHEDTSCCNCGFMLLFTDPNSQVFGSLGGHLNCCKCFCKFCCRCKCKECCPDYIPLSDIRFGDRAEGLKTNTDDGLYVGTLGVPVCCCGNCHKHCCYPTYEYAGSRFKFVFPCIRWCTCMSLTIDIQDTKTNASVGKVIWTYPCCLGGRCTFTITFPATATALEKFLLITGMMDLDHHLSNACCGKAGTNQTLKMSLEHSLPNTYK